VDTELNKASRRLSELPISIELSGFTIDVQWLRVMQKSGQWEIERHAHSSFALRGALSIDGVWSEGTGQLEED